MLVLFFRLLRGLYLRSELNRLLHKVDRAGKPKLRKSVAHQLDRVMSQIEYAEEKSPADRAAVIGVMLQLAALIARE